jgi:hypothetical protein
MVLPESVGWISYRITAKRLELMNTDANLAGSASRDAPGVMERGGFYNEHSQPQHDAGAFGMPMLLEAASAVPIPTTGHTFVVADYGAAQGRNSLKPMRSAIDVIRARTPEAVPIAVVHTDIPGNDFSALFELVETSDASYLPETVNVFSYAAGQSFYRQLFPPCQVSLGWSAIAVHWLSRAPTTIPGHIWSPRATGAALQAFQQQAHADWSAFLQHRAVEMKPGARLVIVGGAADEQGDSGANGLLDGVNFALQEMVREELLSAEEYGRMVIPTYNRMAREYLQPFESDTAGGLRLERQELAILPDPIWAAFQSSRQADVFAAAYVDFFKAAFGPSIFAIIETSRSEQEQQRVKDVFNDKLRGQILSDPAQAVCHWRLFTMLISKPSEA